jgi:hypothetical protein
MSSIGPGRSTIVLILNSAPIVDCENIGGIEFRFYEDAAGQYPEGRRGIRGESNSDHCDVLLAERKVWRAAALAADLQWRTTSAVFRAERPSQEPLSSGRRPIMWPSS